MGVLADSTIDTVVRSFETFNFLHGVDVSILGELGVCKSRGRTCISHGLVCFSVPTWNSTSTHWHRSPYGSSIRNEC